MNENKEHLWQAYLDGELSAIEAADFESSLTDAEQARLMADMRFERVLAERLSEGAECPEEVWGRTLKLVSGQKAEAPPRAARRKRWYFGTQAVAAAAALALAISFFVAPRDAQEVSALVMSEKTVEELVSTSEVELGQEFAERFIQEKGVDLQILNNQEVAECIGPYWRARHWTIRVIGAREETFNGDRITEVLIDCCLKPVKILFADVGSDAARELELAATQDGHVQATRVIGDYVVAVVSYHKSHQLLDLFS